MAEHETGGYARPGDTVKPCLVTSFALDAFWTTRRTGSTAAGLINDTIRTLIPGCQHSQQPTALQPREVHNVLAPTCFDDLVKFPVFEEQGKGNISAIGEIIEKVSNLADPDVRWHCPMLVGERVEAGWSVHRPLHPAPAKLPQATTHQALAAQLSMTRSTTHTTTIIRVGLFY